MTDSRPDHCAHCQKPATLHLTKVISGKAFKLSLCASCPEAAALKQGVGFDLIPDGGAAEVATLPATGGATCPACGLSPADFKESGRLGCSQCYTTFAEKLDPLLGKLHRGVEHLGKVPKGRRREIPPERIAALRRRLEEHVSREEYEMAATVRDQIRTLES